MLKPNMVIIMVGCFAVVVGAVALVVLRPPNEQPSPPPASCIGLACPADPSSRDATTLLEQGGWSQVNSDESDESQLRISGDLLIWRHTRPVNGTHSSDVLGFDFSTGSLLPVAADPNYNEILPFLGAKRVVYLREPEAWAPAGSRSSLVLWDAENRTNGTLSLGLPGTPRPEGFDGSWAVFRHSWKPGSDLNGLWAHNVDDQRLVQLRRSGSLDHVPPGMTGGARDSGVAQGVAYYALNWNDTADQVGMRLIEHDLATNQSRVVYDGAGDDRFHGGKWAANRLAVSDKFVAWDTSVEDGKTQVFVYDRAANRTIRASSLNHSAGFPNVGGDWLTYSYNLGPSGDGGLIAMHLPSGAKFYLIQGRVSTLPYYTQLSATEGTRVVASIARLSGSVFETTGQDLYWRWLPRVSE